MLERSFIVIIIDLDENRIAVWGSSAGGHLVAMLAVAGDAPELEGNVGKHLNKSSSVNCAIDFFGPTDFTKMNDFPSRIDHDAPDSPESQLIGGPVQQNKLASQAASPLKYVSKADAPIFIAHGTKDPLVPFNQCELLHEAYKKANLESTFIKFVDAGHGFRSRELTDRVHRFLNKHLLGQADLLICDGPLRNDAPRD